MKNLLLIVLFLFNSLVFSANVYFDTPNPGDVSSGRTYSSSCTFGLETGSILFSFKACG